MYKVYEKSIGSPSSYSIQEPLTGDHEHKLLNFPVGGAIQPSTRACLSWPSVGGSYKPRDTALLDKAAIPILNASQDSIMSGAN